MRVRVWALWRQPGSRPLEAEPGRQTQAFWRQETSEKQMQDVGILEAGHGRSGGGRSGGCLSGGRCSGGSCAGRADTSILEAGHRQMQG